MDYKRPNENASFPTISGDRSTDYALWRLSVVLQELANDAITREISTIGEGLEKRSS